MDLQRFKKHKDSLLKMNIPFILYTDENFSFIHDPNNLSSIILFDDDAETLVCIKMSDAGKKSINIVEYARVLLIELIVKNDKQVLTNFIKNANTELITQKQKEQFDQLYQG